jgi:hypothetical protein
MVTLKLTRQLWGWFSTRIGIRERIDGRGNFKSVTVFIWTEAGAQNYSLQIDTC